MINGDHPRLSGLVPHWCDEEGLARLLAAWPDDDRFELVVVDNGSRRRLELPPAVRLVTPARNLGFAGALGVAASCARSDLLLVLNPDAAPSPGALEALLNGIEELPQAAGLAPRLADPAGKPQHRWQLKPLPRPWQLVAHTLLFDPVRGPMTEPPPGARVGQPAAAALLLRRRALERLGGLDPTFHPAWFEDVDLGRRLAASGEVIRYWPQATFVHGLGGSVPALGYDRFLPVYYRNLLRYLGKHHRFPWVFAARVLLPLGMLARLVLLPLKRPLRARSRAEAARGLLAAAGVALGRPGRAAR